MPPGLWTSCSAVELLSPSRIHADESGCQVRPRESRQSYTTTSSRRLIGDSGHDELRVRIAGETMQAIPAIVGTDVLAPGIPLANQRDRGAGLLSYPDPVTGLLIARQLEHGAAQWARNYMRDLREDGESWQRIGEVIGLEDNARRRRLRGCYSVTLAGLGDRAVARRQDVRVATAPPAANKSWTTVRCRRRIWPCRRMPQAPTI